MAIQRITQKGRKGHTRISNEALRDKRLSLKAVGLLCLLWSLPDEWNVSADGLASICNENAKSVRATLQELENAGYFRKTAKRNKNKFAGYDIEISDFPAFPFWEGVKTEREKWEGVNTEGVNGRQRKKEERRKEEVKEYNNTSYNVVVVKKSAENADDGGVNGYDPPTVEQVAQECEAKGYDVDPARFVDYYAGHHWRGVTDWRLKLRAWQSNPIDDAADREKREKREAGKQTISSFDTQDFFKNALVRSYGEDFANEYFRQGG